MLLLRHTESGKCSSLTLFALLISSLGQPAHHINFVCVTASMSTSLQPQTNMRAVQTFAAVWAVFAPAQLAHLNLAVAPVHPNALCVAEMVAIMAGEPTSGALFQQLRSQGAVCQIPLV